ncbi:MAG TPA: hypothetical protein VK324_00515, partial [Tepidisphaeraceae bacterium]|nr:hypothetical protein [Tepidisphaeraceae bacterium]
PINETYARRRHELLGSEGEAIYAIDDRFGMVAVRDDRGELFQVGCRLDASVIGAVGKGARVKLVGYNKDANLFTVVPVAEVATAAGSVLRKRVG